jgi:hypothetical protein
MAAEYERLALDYLAAVDLRRFGARDDEYLIRLAIVAIRGAHCARKERLHAGADGTLRREDAAYATAVDTGDG